jgi:hypothetical protein
LEFDVSLKERIILTSVKKSYWSWKSDIKPWGCFFLLLSIKKNDSCVDRIGDVIFTGKTLRNWGRLKKFEKEKFDIWKIENDKVEMVKNGIFSNCIKMTSYTGFTFFSKTNTNACTVYGFVFLQYTAKAILN